MRLVSLDVLRAVAVLLVLGCHADWDNAWHLGGWVGVDLFFVLSGFLVSGLLFNEIKKTGTLNIGRFVIRRGWKIYPAFYAMMAFTIVFQLQHGIHTPVEGVVSELLFVSNYGSKLCCHTWSLAVEEHFYLTLPVLLFVIKRRLDWLPTIVGFIACGALAVRAVTPWPDAYYYTHTRIDALMFGVLIAYGYHFHSARFMAFAQKYRLALATLGITMLLPAFVIDHNDARWMQTVGFTVQFVAAGCLLAAALAQQWESRGVVKWLAWVGTYSYSIYLWHIAVAFWFMPLLNLSGLVNVAMYFAVSIAVGVTMSQLVEVPSLKLRDRFSSIPGLGRREPSPIVLS